LRPQSKLLIVFGLAVLFGGGLMAIWWQSDPHVAAHLWDRYRSSVLQFAIPPFVAGAGWAVKQLLSERPGRSTPDQLEVARQALTGRGREWWRGIPEPAWPGHLMRSGVSPLDVTWSTGTSPSVATPALAGTTQGVKQLAADLRNIQPCRLVIQGPAGSGKSVLARLLMAELLRDQRPGDPVPVFLPAWSWDPRAEPLNEWIKGSIARAYPELGDAAAYGPTAIANLVDQGQILPIIDGIDALPPGVQYAVTDSGQLMSQDRLIITCRMSSFDKLAGFTVISPQDISPSVAAQFLADAQVAGAGSQPAGDDQPLSALLPYLTAPRAVFLASITCRDPGALSKLPGYPPTSAEAADRLLVELLIPAMMQSGDQWDGQRPARADSDLAKDWVRNLARLDLRDPADQAHRALKGARSDGGGDNREPRLDPGNSRITWWNLYRGIGWMRRWQALVRAFVVAALAFIAATLEYQRTDGWQYSLMTAGGYAIVILIAGVCLGGGRWQADPDSGAAHSVRARARRLLDGRRGRAWRAALTSGLVFVIFGALIGLRTALENKDGWPVGSRTGLWDGLTVTLLVVIAYVVAGVPAPPRTARVIDTREVTRPGFGQFILAVVMGVPFGLLWGASARLRHQVPHPPPLGPSLLSGVGTGLFLGIGCWIFAYAQAWFRSRPAPTPRAAARDDLLGTAVCTLLLGVTFAFALGVSPPFNFAGVSLTTWFIVGASLALLGPEWPLYFIAVARLAAARKAPLRLLRFLDTCRECGLMRVIGQEYQIHDDGLLTYLVIADDVQGQEARSPRRRRLRQRPTSALPVESR
jgi:hypothetical protein